MRDPRQPNRHHHSDPYGTLTEGDLCRDLVTRGSFIPLVTAAVRRDWLDRIGPLDESLIGADDYEYWLRIAFAGGRFGLVDEDLGVRILDDHSLSCRPMLTLTSQLRCLRRYRARYPDWMAEFDVRIAQTRTDVIRAAMQAVRTETDIASPQSALNTLMAERPTVHELRDAWAASRPRAGSRLRSLMRKNAFLRSMARQARRQPIVSPKA